MSEVNGQDGNTGVSSQGSDSSNNNIAGNSSSNSWIKPDGSFGDVNVAPEGIKEILSKKQFKTIGDMAKSYSELEKLTGNSIRIPEDGNPEKLAEIYNKLGRPEKPDGYEYKKPENISLDLDDNLLNSFKEYGHKLGLNKQQFSDIVNFQIEAVSSSMLAEMEASEAKLQQTWGKDKETKIKSIVDFANSVGLGDAIVKSGLDRNAELLIALDGLKGKLSEDTIKGSTGGVLNKENRIAELQKNPAFMNRMHPDHKKVHSEWLDLVRG